jgi:hypothetical protein
VARRLWRPLLDAVVGLLGALLLAGRAPAVSAISVPAQTPTATPAPADRCADWAAYAACDEGFGDCYNSALNLTGQTTWITGAGIHSNSGLSTFGSAFNISPHPAEWGTPGRCTGNVCPPGGPAYQVSPRPMPALYRWEDFPPGGYWWNEMCQGVYGEQCHYIIGDIHSNDIISGGLWVVDGNIYSPRFFNLVQTRYTFATSGDVSFNGAMPAWEPFVGSSASGGSGAWIVSTATDPGGVSISGGTVTWHGSIYVPNGLASISATGDQIGVGEVFAWRANLSGANLSLTQDGRYCPPEAGTPTPTPSPTPTREPECANFTTYASCDLAGGNCYNSALNISASIADIQGGGIHSNSGLHTTGSSFNLSPPLAEWGTPGACTGNVCPPGGPAVQVPPRYLPALYTWDEFQPGGRWWNDMCQGAYGEHCHYINGTIGSTDTISSGLWVVEGSIYTPMLAPGDTQYTLVTQGNINFNDPMPAWEPFVGSSASGGSGAWLVSFGNDPNGVWISGSDFSWRGNVYVPYGLAELSASGDQIGTGGVYAWRINMSAAHLQLTHEPGYCPAPLPAATVTPGPSPTPSVTPLPSATVTPTPTPPPSATPTPAPTATPSAMPTPVPSATSTASATPTPPVRVYVPVMLFNP